MGLRDRLKSSVRTVLDRFSGEYSAARDEIRPDEGAPVGAGGPVTRARLRRPREQADQATEPSPPEAGAPGAPPKERP